MNAHRLEILLQHLEGCLRDETFAITQRDIGELESVFAQKAVLLHCIDQISQAEGGISSHFLELATRFEIAQAQQRKNAAEFDRWTDETRAELAEIRRAAVNLRERLGPSGGERSRSTPVMQLWG